jgi:hypothetical protein
MLRTRFLVALGLWQLAFAPAEACTLDEIQKSTMREGFCRGQIGVISLPGCTARVMALQAGDQFKEIALARRCGFNAQADKLEGFYKATTPIIAKLYECVDQPIDQAQVERSAKDDTEKHMASLPQGCPDDIKSKVAKRLPALISIDEQSLKDARRIAAQLQLTEK